MFLYNPQIFFSPPQRKITPLTALTVVFFLTILSLFVKNAFEQDESLYDTKQAVNHKKRNILTLAMPAVGQGVRVLFPQFNPFDYDVAALKETISLQTNQTFASMLKNYGVPDKNITPLIKALSEKTSLSNLRTGTDFHIKITRDPDYDISSSDDYGHQLSQLSFTASPGVKFFASYAKDGSYNVIEILSPIKKFPVYKSGVINRSLYKDALAVGVSPKMIAQSIKKLSQSVDFRNLSKRDKFAFSFNEYYDDQGVKVGVGSLEYAALTLHGKKHEIFYILNKDGTGEWYNAKGSVNKTLLMKTPIDGARISSGFGRRRHPVLGYSKMHKGIDFAAPRGTPIYAAGNGVIVKKYRSSSYGNYIKIKHASSFETAYAHMSKFRSNLREGSSVKQGDIIGYVGSTGRSTGPHLHYEVLKNGVQINPLSKQIPTTTPVPNVKKIKFEQLKKEILLRKNKKAKSKDYVNIHKVIDIRM